MQSLGFTSSAGANLLNIPPAAASIAMIAFCHFVLRKLRVNAFPLIIFSAYLFLAITIQRTHDGRSIVELIGIACFIIMITCTTSPGVRYFALVLVTAASTMAYPVLWPRRVQSVRGTSAAALAIGKSIR